MNARRNTARTDTDRKIFYISDLHLFNENLIHPKNPDLMKGTSKLRSQFSSVEEMHDLIRENWNRKVRDCDTVYVLGDLGLYHADEIADYMRSLNGTKILIMGNHDDKNISQSRYLRSCFHSIHYYRIIDDGGRRVVLYHYPMEQWEGYYRGYYHVHGHTHADKTLNYIPHRYEACVENTGYEPCTLKELEAIYEKRKFFRKEDAEDKWIREDVTYGTVDELIKLLRKYPGHYSVNLAGLDLYQAAVNHAEEELLFNRPEHIQSLLRKGGKNA